MDLYESYNKFIELVENFEPRTQPNYYAYADEEVEEMNEGELDDIMNKLRNKLHVASGREREIILKNIRAIEKSLSKKSNEIDRGNYKILTSYGGDKNITPDVFLNKNKTRDFPFKIVYTFIYFPYSNKIIGEYGDRYLHDSLIKNRLGDVDIETDFNVDAQGEFELDRKGSPIEHDFYNTILNKLNAKDILIGRSGNDKVSLWNTDGIKVNVLDKFMKKLQDVVSKVDLDELYIPDDSIL